MEQEITLKIDERYKQIDLINEKTRLIIEETRLTIESIRTKNMCCIDKFSDKEWIAFEKGYIKDKDV